MKTLVICFGFFLSISMSEASTHKALATEKMMIDLEKSEVSFQKLTKKFKSGYFLVKKGEIKGGELVLDVSGFPLIDAETHPTVTFTLKSATELHNFAPGSPNLLVKGVVNSKGGLHPVETKLFYTPNAHGFEAHGKVPFGNNNTMIQGEADLKIVARS